MAKDRDTESGPRGFGVLLSQIGDGDLQAELSGALHRLNMLLAEHADSHDKATGYLTLKLKITHESNGLVSIDGDVAVKEPKPVRARSVFWTDKTGNLTIENPRQQKLPLREVPTDKARDLPAEERAPARSV